MHYFYILLIIYIMFLVLAPQQTLALSILLVTWLWEHFLRFVS